MFGTKVKIKSMEDRVARLESYPVKKGRILFYGHSLFTRCSIEPINHWGHPVLEECVLAKDGSPACLNHGFGTSCAEHLLYYYHRLVLPYEPRALVLVSASNDFARGYSPVEVMQVMARVIDYFQADFPGAPVYLMSFMPSLRGKGTKEPLKHLRKEYDSLAKAYCDMKEGVNFISLVDAPFFYENEEDIGDFDKIREDIYCEDHTHLNSFGYEMFMDFVKEQLSDIL